MSTTIINYQPWLQAVLNIARHYRIEPSEERIRLQLDWNQHHDIDDMLKIVSRQMGLNVRKNKFERSLLNPWRLPLLVESVRLLDHIPSNTSLLSPFNIS